MFLTEPPAVIQIAREGAGLIDGFKLSLRFDLAGGRIVAAHVSPTVALKDEAALVFWGEVDRFLGLRGK